MPPPPLTRIIATIGPGSAFPATVARLLEAGVSAFRLNFSHGTPDDHGAFLATIRAAAADRDAPVAVIGDLQGPKIRVGRVVEGGVDVAPGETVVFTRSPTIAGPEPVVAVSSPDLFEHARTGDRLLIDDGAIVTTVTERGPDRVTCTVVHGGTIRSAKGINLPDSDPDLEPITERDVEWVRWAVDNGVDFLAQSYVGRAEHVGALARLVEQLAAEAGRAGLRLPIIAKVERPSAVDNARGIIDAADAIMVARGDLGVEMDLARVPAIQWRLTAAAADAGKPCIIATQMLQSMIESPTPTRAEATDVAGAIRDRVDAVMLSGETAVGRDPVGAVATMARIALAAEAHLATQPATASAPATLAETGYRTAALAHGVWVTARDLRARVIVAWSQLGGGARYLSQNRFWIPIVAFSSDERALRQMQLLRGVRPVPRLVPASLDEFTRAADELLLQRGWAGKGDPCILVAGEPLGRHGATNRIALHWVGDETTGFRSPSRQ